MWMSTMRCRVTASSVPDRRARSASRVGTTLRLLAPPAPMDFRSFISVVTATCHPSSTPPTTFAWGTRTSSRRDMSESMAGAARVGPDLDSGGNSGAAASCRAESKLN